LLVLNESFDDARSFAAQINSSQYLEKSQRKSKGDLDVKFMFLEEQVQKMFPL